MINGLTAKLADRIILRSSDGLNNAEKLYPKYKNKLHKVDLWYSFPQYCPPKGNTILFFGRMNRYKGIDCLLELVKGHRTFNMLLQVKQMTAWVIR